MIILTIKCDGKFHAGPKAPEDIIKILEQKYNAKNIFIYTANNPISKIIYRINLFIKILYARIKNEVFVMQFPMYETSKLLNALFMFDLKFINKNKTIALIHDLGGLRDDNENLKQQDIARMKKFKYIIAHNEVMKKYLVDNGINEKNIYVLELFDYLCDKDKPYEEAKDIDGSPNIAYAGNLVLSKSPFIYQLDENKMNFNLKLYGVGVEEEKINKKCIYCGKFPPDELPNNISAQLGLIWDGNFDESDEDIHMKQYTRYNNPHKLSCYMAAGIPVIVWRKSAIAKFVNKYNVGYVVSNVQEISNLNLCDYKEKYKNVQKIKEKVRNGYYIENTMKDIINNIKENGKENEKI